MDEINLIKKIKEKKELSGVDDSIIIPILKKELKKIKFSEEISRKDEKLLIKRIRAELRNMTGRFSFESQKAEAFLENEDVEKILEMHSSTKERKDFYKELNDLISKLNVNSILDLGCGVNPLAILSNNKKLIYYACDINNNELSIVKKFFNKNNLSGEVFICDLRKEIPPHKVDLCIIFKVFDVIEKKGHKLAEQIIKTVNSKYILISFSTKTLSGRPMNHPQRGWIEQLLKRLNFKYDIIKSKNEIFYLVEK